MTENRATADPDAVEEDSSYKAPAQRALQDILATDKEDESLQKYKAALLGSAASQSNIIVKPDDPRKVIVQVRSFDRLIDCLTVFKTNVKIQLSFPRWQSLQLVVDGRPDVTIDLTGMKGSIKFDVCHH